MVGFFLIESPLVYLIQTSPLSRRVSRLSHLEIKEKPLRGPVGMTLFFDSNLYSYMFSQSNNSL